MLKKISFTFLVLCVFSSVCLAQLPYSKMMGLTNSELKERKFKYDAKKNQYVLKKANKTNKTLNILNSVAGTEADNKPHQEDYQITIQLGADDQIATLFVIFYDDNTYFNIDTWIAENNIDPIVTNTAKVELKRFNYDDYNIQLGKELVSTSSVVGNTSAAAKSIDESYNIYTYTISTGIAPDSEWHRKEAAKQEKKKAKGDKADINDLM